MPVVGTGGIFPSSSAPSTCVVPSEGELGWYAVTAKPLRTGITKINYVSARSAQAAADIDGPGSTVVGGPCTTLAGVKGVSPGTTGPHGTLPASGEPAGVISGAPVLPSWQTFLATIESRAFIVRAVEIVLGGTLVLVAVAKLTEGSPLARTVAKVGLL